MKFDEKLFSALLVEAEASDRKRAHHNLHEALDEPVQRLCIALKKGTYVRPHHHAQMNKWELMLALKGSLGLVIFDDDGVIVDKLTLTPGSPISGLEMVPNTWHAVYPQTEDVVILEVKEGPYTPAQESDFAQWAPKEGDATVPEFLDWIQDATIGEKYKLA